jgi:hypothetical protein
LQGLCSLFILPLGCQVRRRQKKAAAGEIYARLVCVLAKRLAHRSFCTTFAVKVVKKSSK